MRTPRLYIKQVLTENSTVVLEQESSHYLCTVLRIKVGRGLVLFNGELSEGAQRCEYQAIVVDANKRSAIVEIKQRVTVSRDSLLDIELACCLIKNDRMDWLLQKATELGVTKISPLLSEFTDVKLSKERVLKKQVHWQQIVISACEQSGRTQVPVVNSPLPLSEWLSQNRSGNQYMLHPYEAIPLRFDAKDVTQQGSIALLVGPEGGLSNDEVEEAHGKGFKSILLGPRILRSETAPLVALSILQSQLGDIN